MRIQHFVALLALSLVTALGARAAVLAGPFTNAANAHTYYLLTHTNWAAAEAEARQLGGHLVTINDAAENQWILNTFGPRTGADDARLWIGLNDVANEGQFVWASGEPVTFTNWYPGEPGNSGPGGEDYGAIIQSTFIPPDGRWVDITDQGLSPFIRTFGIVEVPVVVTQPADQFLPGSARLNGLALPNGSTVLAWFEWGPTPAYGNTTPPQSVGPGANAVGFSNVLVGLISGIEYHFRARGSNAAGLAAGQDQTFNLSVQRPGVTTLAADPLGPTSARMNGQANPRGWPTVAWFEWGTSPAYGNVTPPQSIGSGSNAVGFSSALASLSNGTQYHFRAVASNAFGITAAPGQTFVLNDLRPVVTALAPDQLSNTTARLKGQVNPRGWATTAWFEWGTNASYGNVIGLQDVGQASSVSNLSVVLDGLTAGPNYHYRIVATNVFGVAFGADQAFNLYPPPTTKTWTGADLSGYWSAPDNWSPAGAPANGDDLVFPGGLAPGDLTSTNDLANSSFRSLRFLAGGHTLHGHPLTLLNRNEVIVNGGTNVIACDLTFAGTPETPQFGVYTVRIGSTRTELTVIGNVGGGSLYVMNERLVIRGQFTGGSIRVDYGSLALYGDNPHPVSVEFYAASAGTLRLQGSQPNLNIVRLREMESAECPSVRGDGLVGDVAGCGTITPDPTLSVKSVSGRLDVTLSGPEPGQYGRLVASGTMAVSSARLLPSAGFSPQAGQVYTIVEKTSPGPVPTPFLGPEGTMTTLNGMPFRISYLGGDGNDVTLTATLPQLSVGRPNPAQIRLSWPTNFPGFQLQRAMAIDGPAAWSLHPLSPAVSGGDYFVTQPAATNQEFFRLKRP